MKQKKNKEKKKPAKSGISKKEIRSKIRQSVASVLTDLHIQSPSKKTRKAVKKVSGQIAGKIKRDLKRLRHQKKKKGTSVSREMQKVEATA